MATFASRTCVKHTVGGNNEADEEEIDDVKDANTPDDLPRGFRDFFPGIFGLRSSESSEFGSAKGERGGDKDGTESMEAIEKSAVWRMPKTSPPGQCESGSFRKRVHTNIWHQCNL